MEKTETLMKIDVFLCLVVQEPGVFSGGAPDPGISRRLAWFRRDLHSETEKNRAAKDRESRQEAPKIAVRA